MISEGRGKVSLKDISSPRLRHLGDEITMSCLSLTLFLEAWSSRGHLGTDFLSYFEKSTDILQRIFLVCYNCCLRALSDLHAVLLPISFRALPS